MFTRAGRKCSVASVISLEVELVLNCLSEHNVLTHQEKETGIMKSERKKKNSRLAESVTLEGDGEGGNDVTGDPAVFSYSTVV